MGSGVELDIQRLSQLGEGVATLEGRSVFVRGALPGERVRAEVAEEGGVLRAHGVELLTASADRRNPPCALAARCGGCDWLHLAEPKQREAKLEIVLSTLEHLGGIARDRLEVGEVIHAGAPLAYRRRAVLHPSRGALGFFEHHSHRHVPVDLCPALAPELSTLLESLPKVLAPVFPDTETVELLCIDGRRAVAVMLKGGVKEGHRRAAEAALRSEDPVDGVVLVPREGSAVLIGKPVLHTAAPLRPGVPLYFRPDAFSQANAAANEALVAAALEGIAPSAPRPTGPAAHAATGPLLELYAGNGNFTFALSARASEVVAVESASVSLELARRSAREAKVGNVRFIQGDTRRVVEGLIAEGRRFDAVFLDPPRTGAKGCERWAVGLHASRVVYVACDPAALARDARALVAAGYAPRTLAVIDLFPQTRHVEAVLSFSRA